MRSPRRRNFGMETVFFDVDQPCLRRDEFEAGILLRRDCPIGGLPYAMTALTEFLRSCAKKLFQRVFGTQIRKNSTRLGRSNTYVLTAWLKDIRRFSVCRHTAEEPFSRKP